MARSAYARRAGFQLRPWHHAIAAIGVLGLVVGGAVGAIAVWGSPLSNGPRAVVKLSSETASAPRVSLSDISADPLTIAEEDARFFEDGAETEVYAGDIDPPTEPGVDLGEQAQITLVETDAADGKKPKRLYVNSPLPRAPIAGLHESGPKGPLPIIAADGRTPARAYARPFTGDASKPKIALVLGGLGFNARLTSAAIDELPPEITLSFMPYANDLQTWIDRARAKGHEVLVELPMEPYDLNAEDTGPQTLLASAAARDNIQRLETVLGRSVGYFGVTNYQGARFAASSQASGPIVQALRARGLSFFGNAIGSRTSLAVEAGRAGLPFVSIDRIIDARREAEAIDEQLLNLEALALQNGSALGSGFAFPVTIDQVQAWADSLTSRGFALAPASAVMEGRTARR
jgi:uncharacterized protein